jgi:two-component system sensor histidine kinase KdpD
MWLHGRWRRARFGCVSDAIRLAYGRLQPAVATFAMVGAAALLAAFGERWLDPQSLALFFVLPIVIAAMRYGLHAALAGSVLSVAAINFLFVEPRYTLAVARMQDLAALLLFAAVSVLVSIIAERARALEAARLEAARERFKAELLAGVSHDLRTPLATILFALQSLQRFAASHAVEARNELVDLAEGEARRLSGLVDTLLSEARLEAGRAAVRPEAVSIGDIAAAALSDTQRDVAGLEVANAIAEGLPLISADPALATRALANVIANAAKHGRGSPIRLSARCEDHNVILEVADRGPGLGDNPARLFEKFVRGADGDGRAPGLGLGLALARGFMESQGGDLTAANRDGGGAVFSLVFPCWTKAMRDAV